MGTTDDLQEAVRQALGHLYDPDFLRKSPLVRLFGLTQERNPSEPLRAALEKAIEALRPPAEEPSSSRGWRHYHILHYCYLQELTQAAAANRIGISPRHLRREEAVALQTLTNYLRAHYCLFDHEPPPPKDPDASSPAEAEVNRELHWLADSQGDRTAEIAPVAREAIRLVQALAGEKQTTLAVVLPNGLPSVAMAGTVLKQVLLNLLTGAISSVPGGRVTLAVRSDGGGHIGLEVTAVAAAGEARGHFWPEANVRVARQLVELFHGQFQLAGEPGVSAARVLLPQADQVVVLAIEDNEDTLRLWQRFVRNTRFQLVGAAHPETALTTVAELRPDLIVLDVMLPDIDGWEILGRLQVHPATASTPVIVCTVLPQEELARSLGASGFIQKPMTGRQFRAELERQIAARAQS